MSKPSIQPLLRLAKQLNLSGIEETLDQLARAEFWAEFLTPDRLRFLLTLQKAQDAVIYLQGEKPVKDREWIWLHHYELDSLGIHLPSEAHCLQVLQAWQLPVDVPFLHRSWWHSDAVAIVTLPSDLEGSKVPKLNIGYNSPRQVSSSEFIVKYRLDKWDNRVGQLIWNPDGKFSTWENRDLEILELKIPRRTFDDDLNGRTIKQAWFEKLWNTALYGGKGRTGTDPCFPSHITITDPPV